MWSLEYELIIVLLIASLIGLLMGRFLCKNGESEERIEKEKALYAFADAKNDLLKQKAMLRKLEDSLGEKEEKILELEQQNSATPIEVISSENTQEDNLVEELQLDLIEELNQEKRVHLEEIDSSKALIESLTEKNIKVLEESAELERELRDEIERLEELVILLEADKEKFNKERIKEFRAIELNLREELKRVEVERDDLVHRLKAISSVVGAVGVEEGRGE